MASRKRKRNFGHTEITTLLESVADNKRKKSEGWDWTTRWVSEVCRRSDFAGGEIKMGRAEKEICQVDSPCLEIFSLSSMPFSLVASALSTSRMDPPFLTSEWSVIGGG